MLATPRFTEHTAAAPIVGRRFTWQNERDFVARKYRRQTDNVIRFPVERARLRRSSRYPSVRFAFHSEPDETIVAQMPSRKIGASRAQKALKATGLTATKENAIDLLEMFYDLAGIAWDEAKLNADVGALDVSDHSPVDG